jgi:hypothetical protein
MKKPSTNALLLTLNLATLALALAAGVCLGQANTDQLKIQANGGIGADTNKALVYQEYLGTSAPAGPLSAGMRWCDTNTTPCIPKMYNGSAWIIPVSGGSVMTQADTSSFPGSPTDGQIFYSKSPPSLWVYDSTSTKWATFAQPLVTSAANIRDIYTAAVITPPGAATVAATTGGAMGAGTYSFKITCRTVSGGETTGGTVSGNVTVVASGAVNLSAIPTCGTGGTNRNVYRSKVNTTSGPWYWVANIGDNTTTTYHDGAADGSLRAPDINFSAALPGAWTTINNSANTTTGGCGGTGATRGSMACYGGVTGTMFNGGSFYVLVYSDVSVRGSLSIASYTSGNFTMQYRVKQLSANGDSYLSTTSPAIGGMRAGVADNAVRNMYFVGAYYTTANLPFSSSQHTAMMVSERTSIGGAAASTGSGNAGNPYPEVDALPMWVRWVRRGSTALYFVSSNGVDWTPQFVCTDTNNTNAACSENASIFGASSMDHVELPIMSGLGTTAPNLGWLEIDSFTLTVN